MKCLLMTRLLVSFFSCVSGLAFERWNIPAWMAWYMLGVLACSEERSGFDFDSDSREYPWCFGQNRSRLKEGMHNRTVILFSTE